MLARLLRIRPGEGRTVALVVALMFLSVAGQTIGESAASALFFERVGPDSLPKIYLAQGVAGLLGMLVLTSALGRFDRRRTYVLLPVVLAAIVALERILVAANAPAIFHALWLTASLTSLAGGVSLWGTAGLVTDTRRAKRLFPLFGAGSILGAVAGGLATRPLAAAIGTSNLLILWALAFVGTAALATTVLGIHVPRTVMRRHARRASAITELREGFGFVRRSRLLVWMSIAAVLFSILYYSLYLPFAQAATARYPDPAALAGFFGVFWAVVTAAAFLMSVLLANRLLSWLGAAAMILALPVLYAGGFGVLLVTSTFATIVAIRFAVSAWLQGVSSTSWEALVNVTPEHRRDQTRAFLNGGPSQVGTAIAGVVQIVGQQALTTAASAAIGLVAAVLTIVVAWRIRRSYTAALADAIRAGRPRVFDDAIRAPVAIRRDATAIELAIGALGDREPRTRRLALELLEGSDDPRALESIRGALRDDDATVRAAATRTLAGSLTPDELVAGMADDDPTVRAATVQVAPHDAIPASLFDDPDDSVAVMAAARALGGSGREAATVAIERRLADPRADVRALALRALAGDAPPADADRWARGALDDPSPVVRARALEVLAVASPAAVVEPSLEAIASREIVVRSAARAALRRADLHDHAAELETSANRWSALALADGATAASIASDGAEVTLLRDALRARARARALVSLSIRTARSRDPAATDLALEILADGGSELANALETIEAAAPAGRPLLALWEPATDGAHGAADVDAIVDDADPFIRACADLVRSRREGDGMARTHGATSPIERVLALRTIPLFAALEPAEVQQVAAIASERTYADGEVIDAEGELGDEMHVVVAGSVRVERGGETIARRGPGDIIGEMSVITRAPRIASLIAEGDVRTLRIANREFEGMLRERPEIAIGVMRVLAERLGTASARASTES